MEYKELWIPGFNIENSTANTGFLKGSIGDKQILKATDISSCEVYCPKPHNGGLVFDDMDEAFVIRKGFLFGIFMKITINRINT